MNRNFKIYRFDRLESTNLLARKYPINSVVSTSEQTAGVGRFGRHWVSNGGGLWFSVVFSVNRTVFEHIIIASLAVSQSLGIDCQTKWPNDIYFGGKKLCGILSECMLEGDRVKKLILGIGINVNNEIPPELKGKAISLKEIKGRPTDLSMLLDKILSNYNKIDRLDKNVLVNLYKKNNFILGKEVRVKTSKDEVSGTAVDIDADGCLIVNNKGVCSKIIEGDIELT